MHIRWPGLLPTVFLLCLSGIAAGQTTDGVSPAHGVLILQSPVQAVASINGEGAFLVIPGQDLRWNRIPPGTYSISMTAGPQQWQQRVQIKAGESATLVAVLNPPGPPLSLDAPPPAPAPVPVRNTPPVRQQPPPAKPEPPAPPPAPPPPTPAVSTPDSTTTQQQEKEEKDRRQEARKRLQEQESAQREEREAQRRLQDAEDRARRDAANQEQEQNKEVEQSKKPKRPKVH
jgi:hypothetical protein